MTRRNFPPPWTVETIAGGFKAIDANGQSLAYVYSRENANDARIAKVLTEDEGEAHCHEHSEAPDVARQRLRTQSTHKGKAPQKLGATAGLTSKGD